MKIWITRDTASSILFGGLERLWVWFKKPIYVCEPISEKERDMPWVYLHESNGFYKRLGWMTDAWSCENKFGVRSMSFGGWLGYAGDGEENSELAEFVWGELKKHFHNEEFGEIWAELESKNVVKQEDFLLEIDIKITMLKSE